MDHCRENSGGKNLQSELKKYLSRYEPTSELSATATLSVSVRSRAGGFDSGLQRPSRCKTYRNVSRLYTASQDSQPNIVQTSDLRVIHTWHICTHPRRYRCRDTAPNHGRSRLKDRALSASARAKRREEAGRNVGGRYRSACSTVGQRPHIECGGVLGRCECRVKGLASHQREGPGHGRQTHRRRPGARRLPRGAAGFVMMNRTAPSSGDSAPCRSEIGGQGSPSAMHGI